VYIILVELLAYQFASPVRWIETQDLFFAKYAFERFIEIGLGPTLTGMATRTLKAKYELQDDSISCNRAIFCSSKNGKEIYCQFEDEAVAEVSPESTADATPVAVAAVSIAAPAPSSSGPAAAIADEPLKAVDTLRAIIAQKLKKTIAEIPMGKSMKDLVQGKSTLQNEILGDLQLEFSGAPEKGEELPLEELGSALSSGYNGALGKHTSGLVSRLVGGKMPGGFNATSVKGHLSKAWGLGPSRSDGVLLLATTMEPPKHLGSEAEAKAWLDTVVAAYAQQTGISLSSGGAGGGGGGGGSGGGAVINSEEFTKFQAKQDDFAAQQIELYMRYLNRDSRHGDRLYDSEKSNTLALQAKLDDITREHATSIFKASKLSSNLSKLATLTPPGIGSDRTLLMWYDIIVGRLKTVDCEITSRCIAIMNRADPALLQYMQYHVDTCLPEKGETYQLAKEFGQQLTDNCREAVKEPPKYKDGKLIYPTRSYSC
jgi:fatty acid synthase subunit alpha